MDSFRKSKFTKSQLGEISRKTFGASIRASTELAGGWANTAYALTLDDERTVVLKAAPSNDKRLMRCERNKMSTEVAALKLVQEKDVPVPRVLAYDPGCSLVPAQYFIMEYVAGRPLNEMKDSLNAEEYRESAVSSASTTAKSMTSAERASAISASWMAGAALGLTLSA